MKILLTGGSGFLGNALAHALHQAGHSVALLVRPTSKLSRLKISEENFVIGRHASDETIEQFVKEVAPDVVMHTACTYGRQDETLLSIVDSNVRLGLVIMQSMLKAKISVTFINTGTVLAPNVSPYSLTKHQFTNLGRMLAQQSDGRLRFVNVLLQHMYGPGDHESKFTTHVLRTCLRNDDELLLTPGEQKRDFIFINDVVEAYMVLAQQRNNLEQITDIEVGYGEAPSIREFVETVHKLTQSQTQLKFGSIAYRPNEAMHCQANITFLKTLGWKPQFNLEAGLEETIRQESCR